MHGIDVTNKLERLEVFEERSGVRLDSLSAFLKDWGDNDNIFLTVSGELQSQVGTELQEDTYLVVAVYDSSGRIIGTSGLSYLSENFFGLETFDLLVNLPINEVAKIRIYPKKM